MTIKWAILASAVLLSPMASYADTICGRNIMRGDWRMSGTTEGGNALACDLTFTHSGNLTGNCYVVVDFDNPPAQATYHAVTGQLRLLPTCAIRGSIDLGTAPQILTMTLDGRAWSSANTMPMFAALSGHYIRSGVPVVLGLRLTRRLYGPNPDVPALP